MKDPNEIYSETELTPIPDGPIPGPFPPFPEPIPLPIPPIPRIPWPPDWWRCFRRGPVSGRYEGPLTTLAKATGFLDLRIDVDPGYANSPVMNRISGDFYQLFRISLPGIPLIEWKTYTESWIVDAPKVVWSRCQVEITGIVRFWKGTHPETSVRVVIPWSTFTPAGPAEAIFTETGGGTRTFSCIRKSDSFRDLQMEIDVCASVNAEPILPAYDTTWHSTRPSGLPQRGLTINESYREAGVSVTISPDRTIIDDSAAEFTTWSPAELHDAMETHFSQIGGGWPKWNMWGLLAGTYEIPSVGGIMFDAAAAYGGAGEAPERQGFALFRNHSWFNNLVAGTPANQDQAWAMRHFLYTWVHEAGHAFNFLHSWNKNRPDALSWMNYDWRYDNRNGADSFWSSFFFRFDDEELIHMRHGDRASVIMGGDPWASGGHMEAPSAAMSMTEGNAPIEFLIRSQEYFDFLEPVDIELRIRNLIDGLPLTVDARLSPEFGGVVVYIQRPDGKVIQYSPIFCKLGIADSKILKPKDVSVQGEDRYSEQVSLSYGKFGFYFDRPGVYLIRAIYQGTGDLMVPSNVHRIRIGHPYSKEEDRLAQDFFTSAVGMNLYLQGSRSPHLQKGMEVLESVADRYKGSSVGAKVAARISSSLNRPFFRLKDGTMKKVASPDPKKVLALTDSAVKLFEKEKKRSFNIPYRKLVETRVASRTALGQKAEAKKELATLRRILGQRGANQPVLDSIKSYEDSL